MDIDKICDHSNDQPVNKIAECTGRHEASAKSDPALFGMRGPPPENKDDKQSCHH